MTRRLFPLCFLLIVAVVAGCSPAGTSASPSPAASAAGSAPASAAPSPAGSASAGGSGTADDACDLVTAAEMSAIVGETITPAAPTGKIADGVSVCVYTGSTGAVALTVGTGATGLNASGFAAAAGAGAEPVTGLGDEAYYLPSGGTIYVRQGDTYIVSALEFASVSGDAVKSGVEQIVRTALGRL